MSRSPKVKMYRVPGLPGGGPGSLVVLVVQPRQPRRETVDRRLELGVQVDELAQPLREPRQADLLLPAPIRQLLDSPIGEVHDLLSAFLRTVNSPTTPR